MTKSQYLDMCEQTGQEVDWEKCPPEWEDFPDFILDFMNLYNYMGDRIYPDIGYIGKDFTNFKYLKELYGVPKHQEELLNEFNLFMESRRIKESQKHLKEAHDKMKRKTGG